MADLAFFFDFLRFETGEVKHRFRVSAGPSVQHRRGETARRLIYPGVFKVRPERLNELRNLVEQLDSIHLYEAWLEGGGLTQEGQYVLLAQDRRGTEWGGTVGLSYGIAWQSLIVSLGVDARVHNEPDQPYSYKAYSYGVSLGWAF